MRTCGSLHQQRILMEAPPYPLSSRAKPRDLQFYRPVLEMLFDRILTQPEILMHSLLPISQLLHEKNIWGENIENRPQDRESAKGAV
jgi:hypothetical protein